MRRLFLLGLISAMLLVLLPAMLFATPSPEGESEKMDPMEETMVPAGKYKEAPMLAEKVAAGELPPVDERLPENPLVMKQDHPMWQGVGGYETGNHGGEFNMGITWQTYHKLNWYARPRGYEDVDEVIGRNQIVRYDPVTSTMEPGLVERWELKDGDKTLMLYLRKGVNWSDGVPLTADDYIFTYNDIYKNESLGRDTSGWRVGGESVGMSKVDDWTVKLTCANQLTGFLPSLRTWFLMPKHLTAKYTPGVTPGATQDDFNNKVGVIGDQATHGPWLPVQESEGLVVFERNPFYWKVDYAGRQLPYLDRIFMRTYENNEVIGLELAAGRLTFAARRVPADLGVLMANRDRGNYDVPFRLNDSVPYMFFNIEVKNENLRELFRNKQFRQAMQYSVDQETMGNVLFPKAWLPTWPSLIAQSPYFDESIAQKYNYYKYDLDKAKALLDEAGYKDTTGDGKRNFKDGSPIEWVVDMPNTDAAKINAMEMWREELNKIGITIFVKPVENSIHGERHQTGESDAWYPWWLNLGGDPVLFQPHAIFPEPYNPGAANHAVPILSAEEVEKWQAQGVKFIPGRFPPEMEKMGEIAFEIVALPLEKIEERRKLYKQLQELMWDYPLWVALPPADFQPMAVSRNVGNMPDTEKIGTTAMQHDAYVEFLWFK